MSVKYYGIYLAYAPGLDLRHEGLGRYLAAFVKGASEREDVRFVLVCPSWSREGLIDLFSSEGINKSQLEILSPDTKPMVLRVYESYLERKKRKKKSRVAKWFKERYYSIRQGVMDHVEQRLVTTHNLWGVFLTVIESIIGASLIIAFSPLMVANRMIPRPLMVTQARICSLRRRVMWKLSAGLCWVIITQNDSFGAPTSSCATLCLAAGCWRQA